MTTEQSAAMVDVFLTALEAAGKQVQRDLLFKMLKDEDLLEDVMAALAWDERKDEPSRPFEDFVAEYEDSQK